MRGKSTAPKDIDEYVSGFPAHVQEVLQKVRMTIKEAAPEAEEAISYQIPAFNLKGRYLVYFAAFKKHIGVYPTPFESEELKEELLPYKSGKATARFPLDQPIPFDVISKIVKYRARQNMERAETKAKSAKARSARAKATVNTA
ncbi:MAG: iron chaperone [Acidobacteriota bacterium]